MRSGVGLVPLLAAALLSGCSKPQVEETRPDRPVVSTVTLEVPNMT